MTKEKSQSLVLIKNQRIAKVENSIQITNKIIFNGIEKLINEAFIRLNSMSDLDKTQNFCFLFKYNLIKIEDFKYETKNIEDYGIAVDLLSDALEINPKNELIFLLRGIAYFFMDEYMLAINDSNFAISINSNYSSAYYLRGYSKEEGSCDYKGAINDYKKAIKYGYNSPNVFNKCGNAYLSLKNYKKAIKYFNRAIELNPEFADAFFNRGYAKVEIQNYQGAILDYTKAIEINPECADAFYNRGIAKDNLNEFKGANDDYTKAIEINPEYIKAYNLRGLVKYKLKDYDNAILDYSKAIKINSQEYMAYTNRGLAKLGLDDLEGAFSDINESINIFPHEKSYNSLTSIIHKKREFVT